ncbi:MAG: squalene synthase HpnC [bacterium]|nr:squalene synthase HpnC [bacterium]MDE0351508.1 squalene synthase HpnC [bacterium]
MSAERATDRVSLTGADGPRSYQAGPVVTGKHVELDAVMAKAGAENFPVALRLLPRETRRHLEAIYGYARLVDDLGDEFPGDRSAALDWVDSELDALFSGSPRHPVFRRLAPMVDGFGVPRRPFDRLLAANRLDQHKTRYETRQELLDYCALSANPVGHMVLAVFEATTPERLAASDAVCSGLQVLEHLQDVAEDARAGRVYLPAEDMARFGCSVEDLSAPEAGTALRELVAYESGFARELVEEGFPLVRSLTGYARLAISGFVAGGLAGLDAIEKAGFEVLGGTRRAGRAGILRRFIRVYLGRRRQGDRAKASP